MHFKIRHKSSPRALVLVCLAGWVAAIASSAFGAPILGIDRAGESDSAVVLNGRPGEEAFSGLDALLASGNYQAILALANDYLKKDPESGLALEVKGMAQLLLGDIQQAERTLVRATGADGDLAGPWVKLGVAQMENSRFDQAESSLQKAVSIDANNRFAHQRLGMLYSFLKREDDAIREYRLGLRGASDSYVGITVDLARLLNKKGLHRSAASVLEPRLPQDYPDAVAQLVLADAFLGANAYAKAQLRYSRAAELGSPRLETGFGLAKSLRLQGETDEAMDTINALISEFPEVAALYQERGALYLAMDRPSRARGEFKRASGLGANAADSDMAFARYYAQRDDLDKAAVIYERLLDDSSVGRQAHAQLSEVYLASGRVTAGATLLDDGLKKYPSDSFLLFRSASYLASIGQIDRALSRFEETLQQAPNDPNVLRSYSLALSRAGKLDQSASAAEELYRLVPQPDVALFYATRLQDSGQFDQAVRVYRDLLDQDPNAPLVLNNLASVLTESGDTAEAERLARRAVELVPSNGRLLDTLGWAIHRAGRHEEAAETLKRASQLQPDSGLIQFHYGVAAADAGSRSAARKALRSALESSPDADWAGVARTRLESL
ncbi:MAG: tetratricopeptide repeat protein [Pseudomonadota bacterium]